MKTINVTIFNLKNYFRLYLCQSMCVCLSIRRSMQVNVCDLISNSQWVHLFIAVNAGTKSSALVLLGYAQLALNADATFEFCPHECNKGLLPTILLWLKGCKVNGHQTLRIIRPKAISNPGRLVQMGPGPHGRLFLETSNFESW